MPPNRDLDLEVSFETLFTAASISGHIDDATWKILRKLKKQVVSAAAKGEEVTRQAAKEFTLEEAVQHFGLEYSFKPSDNTKYWKIETLPDVKTFEPSACFVELLDDYAEIYDRSSEAACRTAVDLILFHCIAVMRRKISQQTENSVLLTQPTEDGRRRPTPWDAVKVHCEMSFTHKTDDIPTNPKRIIVGGRVDHGVGIVHKKSPNRLFHSLLLCVEAKSHGNLDSALAQLVVYLACLRQSRIKRGRSDTSVYGVATDGLSWMFVTITDGGVLKQSRRFEVMLEDLPIVLGCLQYILEEAIFMTPNLTPEIGGLESEKRDKLDADTDHDDPIDLDDSPYMRPDDMEWSAQGAQGGPSGK